MDNELKLKRLLYKVEHECGVGTSTELKDVFDELQTRIEDLESENNDYDDIYQSLTYLNDQLFKLEKHIDDNADGTDYWRGMQDAYDMIEP